MKTYIKMVFSSEGVGPKEIIAEMTKHGFTPVVGAQDFHIVWEKGEMKAYLDKIDKMHKALKGMNIQYQLDTQKN